jgi:hypothetical protein
LRKDILINGVVLRGTGASSRLIVSQEGQVQWLADGNAHRAGAPAIIHPDGRQLWCWKDAFHREGGPAVIRPDGQRRWYRMGEALPPGGD